MFSVVIKREQSHEMIKKVWSKVVQSIIQVVFWTHMTFRKRKQKIKFCIVFNTQLTQWKFFKFPRVFWSIALRIKYPYSEGKYGLEKLRIRTLFTQCSFL